MIYFYLENPNRPELVIDAGVPIVCLEYNPRDVNTLVGGLYNGQVIFTVFLFLELDKKHIRLFSFLVLLLIGCLLGCTERWPAAQVF